ncbi:MarR family transcriptional regulator [Cupriavidus pauculus]|uniref:MarR family transcriptional regulator n=1 Tax=Cupriavidus pauculus TaxID=82633 RepID=A0A5P2H072_9BURK|nr:MarR family transcriptional regulator [Cupriavidus pauculus]QET01327.1 MarR family transcriptional regulator [Cupriavidus pauculus]
MTSQAPPPSSTDPFDPDRYEMGRSIGYVLARAKSHLAYSVEQEVSDLDITHPQASCLMMLAKGAARTVTDLGRELGTDAGSVTRLLSRLEKRGLIARTRRDDDRRVVDLSLTSEGEALVGKLPAIYCGVLRRHFEGFTTAEIETLRGLLQRVIDNHQDLSKS